MIALGRREVPSVEKLASATVLNKTRANQERDRSYRKKQNVYIKKKNIKELNLKMNMTARFESLQQAMRMSPLNKKIVKILISAEEDQLKKVLQLEYKNDFLNEIANELKETRQNEKWLANGGYFKILEWGEKVAAESKYFKIFKLIILNYILLDINFIF